MSNLRNSSEQSQRFMHRCFRKYHKLEWYIENPWPCINFTDSTILIMNRLLPDRLYWVSDNASDLWSVDYSPSDINFRDTLWHLFFSNNEDLVLYKLAWL